MKIEFTNPRNICEENLVSDDKYYRKERQCRNKATFKIDDKNYCIRHAQVLALNLLLKDHNL